MSFLQQLKAGMAFGFGGGFGWTLGAALARWLVRLAKVAVLAITVAGMALCNEVSKDTGGNHKSGAAKSAVVRGASK